ncbi:MAG TPA: hypothetical protein VF103_00820 [Polyangiaceae bacterium]
MKTLWVVLFASVGSMVTRGARAQSSDAAARPSPPPSGSDNAPAPTFRHRAILGFAGVAFQESVKVNGESVAVHENGGGGPGFNLGLEERFTRLFSLSARARFLAANTSWGNTVGYLHTRWDLGLEPRLWFREKHVGRFEGYFGIGSGVTLASETPPLRRAYDERIESTPGYYFTAGLGGTYGWDNFALFLEAGYAFHATHFEATLEPRAPGVPLTVEDRDYFDHGMLLSFGIVAGFGALP